MAANAQSGDLGGPAESGTLGLQGLAQEQIVEEGFSKSRVLLGGPAMLEARAAVVADVTSEAEAEAIFLQGTSLLVPLPPLTTETSVQERAGITSYTVASGDTVSSIAARFGVTMDTVLWENKLRESSTIQPGQVIRILPVSGVKHEVKSGDTLAKIAKRYNASVDEIIAFNTLPADEGSVLHIGEALIVPGGEQPAPPAPVRIATPRSGSGSTGPSVAGYFIFPTTGYNFGRRHAVNGTDIANSCGTPIYAAAVGAVIEAKARGWNGGYGNYVKIQHPNGTQTLYGHMDSVAVAPGEPVNQGDPIGLMGNTGRSTGCHLHFEVRGATNPFVRYR